MSIPLDIERLTGNPEVLNVLSIVNTGRRALLGLSIPPNEVWQSDVDEDFRRVIEEASSVEPGIPLDAGVRSGIINLEKLGIIERFDVEAPDSRGRIVLQKRIITAERWGLAVYLAAKLAEISFGNRIPLAALVGESSMKPSGSIDTSTIIARLAIFSDLIEMSQRDDAVTNSSKLSEAGGVHNARSHADDLVLMGILEPTKTDLNDWYALTEGHASDSNAIIKGNGRTKPEVVELRELILELLSSGDQSVVEIIATIGQCGDGTPLSIFCRSLTPESLRTRVNKELNRFEHAGIIVKKFEGGIAYRVAKNGLQIVRQYLSLLRELSETDEEAIKTEAPRVRSRIIADHQTTLWLAQCDYSGGKFRRAFTNPQKDEMIAQALAEGPLTPAEIAGRTGGALSEQVVRRHLVSSQLFQPTDHKTGASKVWVLVLAE